MEAPLVKDLQDPSTWGAVLRSARLHDINQRWADTALGDADLDRPVVLFLHGWPESWFSWRHQLLAVKAAGYRGIAPDMRGYGGTAAPTHVASYGVHALAGDMLALMRHVGAHRVALVGHDHGANLGWKLALLHPEAFVCYMALSVPYGGRTRVPVLENYRQIFGDERKPESDPDFFYMLHHNLPDGAKGYAKNTRAVFRVLFGDSAGATPAPVSSKKLFVNGVAEPMWRRARQPIALAPWISESEVDYFVAEFERAGWDGGMNWYRVLDMDWHATPELQGANLSQPVAFVAGLKDMVVNMYGGKDNIKKTLCKVCEQPPSLHFFDGAGHWIQQERPMEVNAILLEFLSSSYSVAPLRSNL
mmetsp:Transcript_87006/g.243957  ORF Transcript_87006/g.243957 Transcript_87006/m.243957 type:complete len:361 (+) Transcript_87006:100-1182(+)|eukprot:CAMPEP_0117474730 /NCGR_PEP_ID=MMETSP0784-20121206/9433_1 /TAXON_ID=39447 /ORGANISM="" /LENGTH=360 /DNA_ID=CAMNT_0005268961 /DNA_START=87 /DNA_END=1169 /DNA_ORIENTATION=-